jgi:hypothetical protein
LHHGSRSSLDSNAKDPLPATPTGRGNSFKLPKRKWENISKTAQFMERSMSLNEPQSSDESPQAYQNLKETIKCRSKSVPDSVDCCHVEQPGPKIDSFNDNVGRNHFVPTCMYNSKESQTDFYSRDSFSIIMEEASASSSVVSLSHHFPHDGSQT